MSVPYTALARRYRPQTFDEVIGQGHVAQALRNAVRKDRVSHAYLFTGARGVGKTSTARIFAKALNCPNAVDAVPCNECDICRSIAVGQDVDVSEIDAASNRGIDDIRQLRANVNLRPMRSRHKIYIIDEAHQLSKDAWNALLKTLEEPPPNVKFFFCTTEPNKLPDTILSRCQRFDFSTVDQPDIITRLEQIAVAEGFTVEPAALDLVARRAAGSMRDSQSLFDQLLAFGGDSISVADVHRLFGTADDERLIGLGRALADRQPGEALTQLNGVLDAGVQLGELFDQLIAYFRDLMVLAAGAETVPLLAVANDRRGQLAEQANHFGLQTLLAATQILSEARGRMARTSFARPLGELALARVAVLNDLDELSDLIAAVRGGTGRGTASAGRRATAAPARWTPPVKLEPPAAPASLPARPEPPRPDSAASAVVSQKKSEPSPPAAVQSGQPTVPQIAFAAGSEAVLLEKLKERTGAMLSSALPFATPAIIGPTTLELTFPKRYNSARQFCESASGRSQIESALLELTGQPVRLVCREDSETAPSEPPATASRVRPATRQRSTDVSDADEFVQRVVSLFEAKIVKVSELNGPAE